MKRIAGLLLVLSLMLLSWGCHKEEPNNPDGLQIRYEDGTAVYTQEGGEYTMELRFEKPVAADSEISVLLGDQEVLSFTTQATVSRLQLTSSEFARDLPYTLKVNGKLQHHGAIREEQEFPQPGDIPEPSLPTIPVEPMGQIVTIPTQDEGEKQTETVAGISLSDSNGDIPFGEIPALLPNSGGEGDSSDANGSLPIEPFKPHGQEDNGLETGLPQISPQRKSRTFTLTEKITVFISVGDAT